ncbi:hypothetical protein DF055_22415 [Burkholderia cepacia]|nr:hypothetical protein DF055_22415 [Burkholderia cepacia]
MTGARIGTRFEPIGQDVVGLLGRCIPAMRGYDLTVRYNAWLGLAKARSQREQRCWNGGDPGRQQAMANA